MVLGYPEVILHNSNKRTKRDIICSIGKHYFRLTKHINGEKIQVDFYQYQYISIRMNSKSKKALKVKHNSIIKLRACPDCYNLVNEEKFTGNILN